jgi:hypothetical protein
MEDEGLHSQRKLKIIILLVLSTLCCISVVLIYYLFKWVNYQFNNPETFAKETHANYIKITNQYNALKTSLVIAYDVEQQTVIDSTLFSKIDKDIANFNTELQTEQKYLSTAKTDEFILQQELTGYYQGMQSTPIIAQGNYKIYLYYIQYVTLYTKFNQQFKSASSNLTTETELISAQGVIAQYQPLFETIRENIASSSPTTQYQELKTSVLNDIDALITYLQNIKSKYSELRTTMSKGYIDEIPQYAIQINMINTEYLLQTTEQRKLITKNRQQLLDSEKVLTQNLIDEKLKLDKIYNSLSSKYKLEI